MSARAIIIIIIIINIIIIIINAISIIIGGDGPSRPGSASGPMGHDIDPLFEYKATPEEHSMPVERAPLALDEPAASDPPQGAPYKAHPFCVQQRQARRGGNGPTSNAYQNRHHHQRY